MHGMRGDRSEASHSIVVMTCQFDRLETDMFLEICLNNRVSSMQSQ